jgi:uncharacterized protein YciI
MMETWFVLRRRGAGFDPGAPVEGQPDWDGHAACMIRLAKAGALLFSGPFGDREGALLIFRAEDQAQVEAWVAEDPWTNNEVLVTERIARWDVRIGQLPGV